MHCLFNVCGDLRDKIRRKYTSRSSLKRKKSHVADFIASIGESRGRHLSQIRLFVKLPTSLRGRGLILDIALLATIVLSIAFIGYSVWKRGRPTHVGSTSNILHPTAPVTDAKSSRLARFDSVQKLPPNSYRRLKATEDLVGQKMRFSDLEWEALKLDPMLASLFTNETPSCDRYPLSSYPRSYWVISDHIVEQLLSDNSAIIPNVNGERCFSTGPDSQLFHFTNDPSKPAVSLVGDVWLDSILSLRQEHLLPELALKLRLSDEELKFLLEYKSRKPDQNSTFVRVRLKKKGAPVKVDEDKEALMTPTAIPRLSRMRPGLMKDLINEVKSRGTKVVILDLRSSAERTDTLFESSDFKSSQAAKWIEVRNAVFSLRSVPDEGRKFRFDVKLGDIKNAEFRLNLPANYTPKAPMIIAGVDEFDARAFWLILSMAIDHPSYKVYWARDGAEKLATETFAIRGI